jgi:hypothetical protein
LVITISYASHPPRTRAVHVFSLLLTTRREVVRVGKLIYDTCVTAVPCERTLMQFSEKISRISMRTIWLFWKHCVTPSCLTSGYNATISATRGAWGCFSGQTENVTIGETHAYKTNTVWVSQLDHRIKYFIIKKLTLRKIIHFVIYASYNMHVSV